MPLSALIIDDEQLARDELNFLLKNVGDVNVVAQGKNGVEAINLIREHSPDLVFLDVQMVNGERQSPEATHALHGARARSQSASSGRGCFIYAVSNKVEFGS